MKTDHLKSCTCEYTSHDHFYTLGMCVRKQEAVALSLLLASISGPQQCSVNATHKCSKRDMLLKCIGVVQP